MWQLLTREGQWGLSRASADVGVWEVVCGGVGTGVLLCDNGLWQVGACLETGCGGGEAQEMGDCARGWEKGVWGFVKQQG